MHEYSLMERLIEAVTDDLEKKGITGRAQVNRVTLRLGAMELHSEESFIQAFQMITQGTILEGSDLDLYVVPAEINCTSCNYKGPIHAGEADCHDPSPVVECPNCGAMCVVQGGRGVDPIQLELKAPGAVRH